MEIQHMKFPSFRPAQHGIETVAVEFCTGHSPIGVFEFRQDPMPVSFRRFVAFALLISYAVFALLVAAISRVTGRDLLLIGGLTSRGVAATSPTSSGAPSCRTSGLGS